MPAAKRRTSVGAALWKLLVLLDFVQDGKSAALQRLDAALERRGYALVTDDNLRTLGHVASSRELTESDPSVRFEPVDWVFSDGVEAFDEPCAAALDLRSWKDWRLGKVD